MKDNLSKHDSVTMEQAILDAQKEIGRIVDGETDPMLRAILNNIIDLSPAKIADSIEKKYIEGTIIRLTDDSIDMSRSTINTDLAETVRQSLEKAINNYLTHHAELMDPENISSIFVNETVAVYAIKEDWDFWALQPQLVADQAIPLMNGLDPESWEENLNGKKELPNEMRFSIKQGLKIAHAERFSLGTPAQWLDWGREKGLDKPILKSDVKLPFPDVSMFYLFETAVNKASKSSIHSYAENCKETSKEASEPADQKIYNLFVPVRKKAIIILFDKISEPKWKDLFSRAASNGLKNIRKAGNEYNPAEMGEWLVRKGYYTREHVNRKLANNLPECNKDKKSLITGDLD